MAVREVSGEALESVGRALDVLETLGREAPRGVRVTDVARQLKVNPATISRLLRTFVQRGYATQLADRSYTVGARSLRLATPWLQTVSARAGAAAFALSSELDALVIVLQLLGERAVAVARARAPHLVTSDDGVDAWPLAHTAGGRALLSGLPPVDRVALLPPEPYVQLTPKGITTWRELSTALSEGERRGYFQETGEVRADVGCIAVPFRFDDMPAHLALAVPLAASRAQREGEAIGRRLREVARDITQGNDTRRAKLAGSLLPR